MSVLVSRMPTPRPWYRQLWPWLLMVPPLGAVAGGIATIYLAIVSDDGLVSSDYYRDGLAINQVMAKDRRAVELGLAAAARFNPEDGRVQVLFEPPLAAGAEGLQMELLHPTRDRFDQTLALSGNDGSQYLGSLEDLPPGLWYVRIEPADGEWRLSGRLRIPGELQAELLPAAH